MKTRHEPKMIGTIATNNGPGQDAPNNESSSAHDSCQYTTCPRRSRSGKRALQNPDYDGQSELLDCFVGSDGRRSPRYLAAFLLSLHGELKYVHCEEERLCQEADRN
jgi:hypothetical protein